MKIQLAPSALGTVPYHLVTTILINDTVAIDAGSLGFLSPLDVQQRVRHLLLSHSHQDHIGSLPIFLDNVFSPRGEAVNVYASNDTFDAILRHQFNETIWPDLVRLSQAEAPFLQMHELHAEQAVTLDGLTVTPIELNHVVPTFGFLVDDGASAVAIVSDTAPTEAIWQAADENPRLKAVLVEASFPNHMAWLANKSRHLTPQLLKGELKKLNRRVPVLALHVKTSFYALVLSELRALGIAELEVMEPGRAYHF